MSNPVIGDKPPSLTFWPCPDVTADFCHTNPLFGEFWVINYQDDHPLHNAPTPGDHIPFALTLRAGDAPHHSMQKIYEGTPSGGVCEECQSHYEPHILAINFLPFPPQPHDPDTIEKSVKLFMAGRLCADCLGKVLEQDVANRVHAAATAAQCKICQNTYLIDTIKLVKLLRDEGSSIGEIPPDTFERFIDGGICGRCIVECFVEDWDTPQEEPQVEANWLQEKRALILTLCGLVNLGAVAVILLTGETPMLLPLMLVTFSLATLIGFFAPIK